MPISEVQNSLTNSTNKTAAASPASMPQFARETAYAGQPNDPYAEPPKIQMLDVKTVKDQDRANFIKELQAIPENETRALHLYSKLKGPEMALMLMELTREIKISSRECGEPPKSHKALDEAMAQIEAAGLEGVLTRKTLWNYAQVAQGVSPKGVDSAAWAVKTSFEIHGKLYDGEKGLLLETGPKQNSAPPPLDAGQFSRAEKELEKVSRSIATNEEALKTAVKKTEEGIKNVQTALEAPKKEVSIIEHAQKVLAENKKKLDAYDRREAVRREMEEAYLASRNLPAVSGHRSESSHLTSKNHRVVLSHSLPSKREPEHHVSIHRFDGRKGAEVLANRPPPKNPSREDIMANLKRHEELKGGPRMVLESRLRRGRS
jgi:hypothetical protein